MNSNDGDGGTKKQKVFVLIRDTTLAMTQSQHSEKLHLFFHLKREIITSCSQRVMPARKIFAQMKWITSETILNNFTDVIF
ncbi:MAG: hypothetical protein ABIM73_08640 [Arenimonas sp.]